MPQTCLSVRNLRVGLPDPMGRMLTIVRDIGFDIPDNGFHALVGESGCGKSVTAMALTRLPPVVAPARVSGNVFFRGIDLLALSAPRLRQMRRRGGIAYVFQDPMSALNPVLTIGLQLREACPRDCSRSDCEARLLDLLRAVGFPDPALVLRAYPCELSGGMAQRVCIAMAMAQEPALLVADEPTTALDVITQRLVLDSMKALCAANGTAVLLITHNLLLVSQYARTVSVLYAGQCIEDGPTAEVLSHPFHPYTSALLAAVPRLTGSHELHPIPGRVPLPSEWKDTGCTFAPRCSRYDPKHPCAATRFVQGEHSCFCAKPQAE